ncbi:hypothetical protein [Circovirus-like genome DCCV-8]|uniref:Uncharacterized protein n=1 Tax=Circovirus-like genome DCCV-8 TaxID=1788448 RepID=A0A190WHB6_9VIRU|nr:hypothetical protein [Circovirus-like genome DCCV-8]AMB42977.1 hypothetical protein [Circovirus-like genome DCCV-8]
MQYAKKRRTGQFSSVPTRTISTPSTGRRIPVRPRRKRPSRKRAMRNKRAAHKAIKSVVEKVISCKDNVGIYTKAYGGDIRTDVNLGTKSVIVHAQRLQENTDPYSEFGMRFTPFILKRVLDAASVLYKAKPKSVAGPGQLGAPNFDYKGLKVDVLYASYHLAATNMTNTKYYVEIVEFTNKFNGNAAVMDVVQELLKGTNFQQGEPSFTNGLNGRWRIDCDLEFGMIKGLSSRYAMKSFGRKLVRPGETINYFTKDKMCIDFQRKLFVEGESADPEVPSYAKGEKQVVLVIQPVTGLIANATKHTVCMHTVDDKANFGFVVKVNEVFKILEPDATLDANQGDKRVFLSDFTVPEGVVARYDRDQGGTLNQVISEV